MDSEMRPKTPLEQLFDRLEHHLALYEGQGEEWKQAMLRLRESRAWAMMAVKREADLDRAEQLRKFYESPLGEPAVFKRETEVAPQPSDSPPEEPAPEDLPTEIKYEIERAPNGLYRVRNKGLLALAGFKYIVGAQKFVKNLENGMYDTPWIGEEEWNQKVWDQSPWTMMQ